MECGVRSVECGEKHGNRYRGFLPTDLLRGRWRPKIQKEPSAHAKEHEVVELRLTSLGAVWCVKLPTWTPVSIGCTHRDVHGERFAIGRIIKISGYFCVFSEHSGPVQPKKKADGLFLNWREFASWNRLPRCWGLYCTLDSMVRHMEKCTCGFGAEGFHLDGVIPLVKWHPLSRYAWRTCCSAVPTQRYWEITYSNDYLGQFYFTCKVRQSQVPVVES